MFKLSVNQSNQISNTKKTISRDSTPISKKVNKSIEVFGTNKNTSSMNNQNNINTMNNDIAFLKKSIKKRNSRPNSIGMNAINGINNTEIYCNNINNNLNNFNHTKINMSYNTDKTQSKKSSTNKNLNSNLLQSWSKLTISKIPKKGRNNLSKSNTNTCLINNNNKTRQPQTYIQTTSSSIINHYRTHTSDMSSCEMNSNSSGRQHHGLSKETQNKLNQLSSDLANLINNKNMNEKKLIFNEIDKIYKNLIINCSNLNNSCNKNCSCGNINNCNNSVYMNNNVDNKINNILIENKDLKRKNDELSNKIDIIEDKLNSIIKDNEDLREEINKKNLAFEEMKINMRMVFIEIQKIKTGMKNENQQSNRKTNKKVNKNLNNNNSNEENEYDDSSMDNISLAENLNINNIDNKYTNYNFNINNNQSEIKNCNNLNLNFKKIADFNEEFLNNYDEFSPSWRREADKMMNRQKK